jgi:aryl-alcohol dehydrogenase-like predicted oxidoreductase
MTGAEAGHGHGRGRSRLAFGTIDLPDTSLAPRLLDRFYAGGGRALDVATVYRDGESEQAVGKWLRARHAPDDVVVYAKACHPPYCLPELVPSELDKSCRLLGLDWIDVFVLHRDEPSLPVAAFADALLEQVAAKRIGAFGVSNWTVPRLRELQDYLERIGEDRLVAFSNHFSLAEMVTAPWPGCLALDKQDLLALADTDLRILAWSSLAIGFFAGRDTPYWDSPGNRARRERATELADALGTSTAAVALAYVFHQPENVLPVVGTRSEAHLDEALAASEIELSPSQLHWLETGARPGA